MAVRLRCVCTRSSALPLLAR